MGGCAHRSGCWNDGCHSSVFHHLGDRTGCDGWNLLVYQEKKMVFRGFDFYHFHNFIRDGFYCRDTSNTASISRVLLVD